MKNVTRKSMAMVLALAISLSSTPAFAFADSEELDNKEMNIVQEQIEEKIAPVEEIKKAERIENIEMFEKLEKFEEKAEKIEAKAEEAVEEKTEETEKKAEEAVEETKEIEKTEEIELVEKKAEIAETLPEAVKKEEFKEAVVEEIKKVEEKVEEIEKTEEKAKEAIEEKETVEEEIEEEVEEEEEAFVSDIAKITISGTKLTVYQEDPDQTAQLKVTCYNKDGKKAEDQEVIWSSLNEKLATVDENGLVTVTAEKTGSVKIKAVAANKSEVSATTTIYIKNVAANNISFSMSGTNTATVGVSEQRTANVTGNAFAIEALGIDPEYTWEIIPVDGEATITQDGYFTPLKAGKVKILLTCNYNTNTQTKTITIKDAVAVTRISISPATVAMELSEDAQPTKKLTATVSPSTATFKNILWSSSDESVATVDSNGLVTGVGEGTAIITATSESNPDVKAEAKITVSAPAPKTYKLSIHYYFTKTFGGHTMTDGEPDDYYDMESSEVILEAGSIIDADDYMLPGGYTPTYKDNSFILGGSYVSAKNMRSTHSIKVESDIDIFCTYSIVAPYSFTIHFKDADTNETIKEDFVRRYDSQLGYIEQPYKFEGYIERFQDIEGYEFKEATGDFNSVWSEENGKTEGWMYFSKIVEEPIIEEPIEEEPIEKQPVDVEPIAEEPVIEEPTVEEPEIVEPEVEEIVVPARSNRTRNAAETVELIEDEDVPQASTDSAETEEIEEIAEIEDEETPMASFEVAETEVAESAPMLLDASPLTGGSRSTAGWEILSLAALLGILLLEGKKRANN